MQLTAKQVKKLMDYDPRTGEFRWRKRPLRTFGGKENRRAIWISWNNRFAGKIAGYVNKYDSYRHITIGSVHFMAHRLAWLITHGKWPENGLDHINGIGADNRIVNLRAATQAENNQNRTKMMSNNTSGCPGVSWHKRDKRWRASITVNHRTYNLGYFDSKEGAFAAYKAAKQRYHTFHPFVAQQSGDAENASKTRTDIQSSAA